MFPQSIVLKRTFRRLPALFRVTLLAVLWVANAPAQQTTGIRVYPGLNAVSLPLQPASSAPYTLERLASDTRSPFVVYLAEDDTGNPRFRVCFPVLGGSSRPVAAAEGYVVHCPAASFLDIPLSGSPWPSATRSLSAGLALVGMPAGVPTSRTVADLLAGASGLFAVAWTPDASGRTRPRSVIAGQPTSTTALTPGSACLLWVRRGTLDLASLPAAPGLSAPATLGSGTLPAVTTAGLPRGLARAAYRTTIAATGSAPFEWSTAAGGLPPGLALLPSGSIDGAPAATGVFSLTVLARNATGTSTRALSLTVDALAAPAVLTTTLPDAVFGESFAATLRATGTAPIDWQLWRGSLPAGVALLGDGSLGGTPAASGVFVFAFRAAGAAGSAVRPLTLTVQPILTPLGPNARGFQEYRAVKDGSTLIEVPAGSFTMGINAQSPSGPVHEVSLSRYLIGKLEVTTGQYRAFLAARSDARGPLLHAGHWPDEPPNKDHTPFGWGSSQYSQYSPSDACPVIYVDWYDAYAYAAWAGLRLPTEAEWECAARGRNAGTYPWGEAAPDAGGLYRANYLAGPNGDADGYLYLAPDGSFPGGISPFGALDLAGNAWEWGRDWYDAAYYSSQTSWTNPTGPSTGTARIVRGGGWDDTGVGLHAGFRFYSDPALRSFSIGFRVAQ